MSDGCWIRTRIRGFLLLLLLVLLRVRRGFVEVLPVRCVLRGQDEGLNCTWNGNTHTQHNLSLRSVTYPHDISTPRVLVAPPGQNWLLIPRENLVKYNRYRLQVKGEGEGETMSLTLTYPPETGYPDPPVLSQVQFPSRDPLRAEVSWSGATAPPHGLELRYRRLGDSEWTEVGPDDLEPEIHELWDLELYTSYEVQIRYRPDEHKSEEENRWSDPLTFSTPEAVPCGSLDVWRRSEKLQDLHILWKPPDPRCARGHILSYLVTYTQGDGSRSLEAPCCTAKLPSHSTRVCVSARNTAGLGSPTCATPLCSDLPPPWGIRAWGEQARGVGVWWGSPLSPTPVPPTYLVEWAEVTEVGTTGVDWTRSPAANQSLALPGDFAPQVRYLVSVIALYYNSSNCSPPVSTIIYSQEGVSCAPPHVSVHLQSPTVALVSWDEIPEQQQKGILTHYTVYVNSKAGGRRHNVSDRTLLLSGLSPGIVYEAWVTASTGAGEGPPGEVVIFQTTGSSFLLIALLAVPALCLLVTALICLHRQRIPEPKPNHLELCTPIYSNGWHSYQVSLDPPVTVVEEVPLPTPEFTPTRTPTTTSGYEIHFMPTPEDVEGLY